MHIERIFFQQNFRTHPGIDPFLFATYGIGIFINPGENVDDANIEAERLVNEYIQKHTHYPDHQVVEEMIIPDIQVQKDGVQVNYDVVIEEINKCQTIDDLDGWNLIAKGNHEAGMAFAKKAAFLLSPDNKKRQLQDEEVKQIMSKPNAASKLKKLKQLKP